MDNKAEKEFAMYNQKIAEKENQIDDLNRAKKMYESSLEQFHIDMKSILSKDTELSSSNNDENLYLEKELDQAVTNLQEEIDNRKKIATTKLEDEREELYKERNETSW